MSQNASPPRPEIAAPPAAPPRTSPTKRRPSYLLWILIAGGLAAIAAVVVIIIVIVAALLFLRPGAHPAPSANSAPLAMPAAKQPVRVKSEDLHANILATAALAPVTADGDPAQSLLKPAGRITCIQRRPWVANGEILLYAVEVDTRPAATSPWFKSEALVEVTVDSRGQVVQTRTLRIKDPDELELERAASAK